MEVGAGKKTRGKSRQSNSAPEERGGKLNKKRRRGPQHGAGLRKPRNLGPHAPTDRTGQGGAGRAVAPRPTSPLCAETLRLTRVVGTARLGTARNTRAGCR